jgi:hypothetical protein
MPTMAENEALTPAVRCVADSAVWVGSIETSGERRARRRPVAKRVNSSRAPDDDPSLIEIDANVATSNEVFAMLTHFR